jgi:hypothetical protein
VRGGAHIWLATVIGPVGAAAVAIPVHPWEVRAVGRRVRRARRRAMVRVDCEIKKSKKIMDWKWP